MAKRVGYRLLFLLILAIPLLLAVKIEKKLVYDKYSLDDEYEYQGEKRAIKWDQIENFINLIDTFYLKYERIAVLSNYKNKNGVPPVTNPVLIDRYGMESDTFGVTRVQSVPLYKTINMKTPNRYALDGSLVGVRKDTLSWVEVEVINKGVWNIPRKYVSFVDSLLLCKMIFIDKENQNMVIMEQQDSVWIVLSTNPVSTGVEQPPYKRETPSGVFMIQNRSYKMFYYKDGTQNIEGFSPYATRFTRGAYIHGIPVNYPRKSFVEYSWRLGTKPCTHMCVRTATSHAKFIYNWVDLGKTVVVVF